MACHAMPGRAASRGTNSPRRTRRSIDFIFTVCANAAGEACPIWPGHPATAHWGIADPAHVEPLEARRAAFEIAYSELERRIAAFLKLPRETMSTAAVAAGGTEIHDQAGA